MSYTRLYPTKNNTLFHYLNQNADSSITPYSENINCGANPVMELMDGRGESKLIWQFTIPSALQTKLSEYSYTCNLQLFDAGTLFLPAINLTEVTLTSFTDDFSEGDGYSFLAPANLVGNSNWLYRDSINLWSATTFTPVTTYNLNRVNEDLTFDITNSVNDFISSSTFVFSYALSITNHTQDNFNVYTKYIHSSYTKTVFKPYIEFIINDNIVDETFDCVAGSMNAIYLLNQTGGDFTITPTCSVLYSNSTIDNPTVNRLATGVYYIVIVPPYPTTIKPTYATVTWTIGGVDVQKQIIQVASPNKLVEDTQYQNLYFYPSTPYSHNIVRQGDVMPFQIVSQIRGQGDVVVGSYEYRITSADGFEMTPWTAASVYRKKMFFYVDTTFFYPENQYEVWVRNTNNNFTITSNLTYKFKIAMNDKSHLRELSTSPYYSREQFIQK